jgi:hypothetical protein
VSSLGASFVAIPSGWLILITFGRQSIVRVAEGGGGLISPEKRTFPKVGDARNSQRRITSRVASKGT